MCKRNGNNKGKMLKKENKEKIYEEMKEEIRKLKEEMREMKEKMKLTQESELKTEVRRLRESLKKLVNRIKKSLVSKAMELEREWIGAKEKVDRKETECKAGNDSVGRMEELVRLYKESRVKYDSRADKKQTEEEEVDVKKMITHKLEDSTRKRPEGKKVEEKTGCKEENEKEKREGCGKQQQWREQREKEAKEGQEDRLWTEMENKVTEGKDKSKVENHWR